MKRGAVYRKIWEKTFVSKSVRSLIKNRQHYPKKKKKGGNWYGHARGGGQAMWECYSKVCEDWEKKGDGGRIRARSGS